LRSTLHYPSALGTATILLVETTTEADSDNLCPWQRSLKSNSSADFGDLMSLFVRLTTDGREVAMVMACIEAENGRGQQAYVDYSTSYSAPGTTAAYRVPRPVRAIDRAWLLSPTPRCPRYLPRISH